ncbi:SBF-like CPA transporter family-domain-containing protein [Zopfochytrium polystomum]|nr:SBF-like CPA transporter family-domain-containing protein [Zopfochytrium polystomum]
MAEPLTNSSQADPASAASPSDLTHVAQDSFLVSSSLSSDSSRSPTPPPVAKDHATPTQRGLATEDAPNTNPSVWTKIWAFVCKHWFLEGLGCVILLAFAWPNLGKKHGIIRADITVSYVVVALIFIISGMSLKTKVLLKSMVNWKMHILIQGFSLGITPVIGLGVGRLLGLSSFNDTLIKGLIIATSTPTTISSNVLMTKQANGDEAGALTNAVIGNILGVFISPSLIFAYAGQVGNGTSLDYKTTFTNLTITVVAPLIVGQLIQILLPKVVTFVQKKVSLPIVNSSMLLVLVWSVFCDTFSEHIEVDAGSIVSILFLDLALFCLFSSLCFVASRIPVLGFSRPATVAIVMCGATKTVALGIPMINIIYSGSPLIGVVSTPLLIYHAEQLVVGSFLVNWLKVWVDKHAKLDEERLLSLPVANSLAAPVETSSSSTLSGTGSHENHDGDVAVEKVNSDH